MAFEEETLRVGGVDVVMLTAGSGPPLMFWHGAGTFTGFDFALPWAQHFRVMIPFHPGFGLSGDDLSISSTHDYVVHYLELLDHLGLDQINLVGFSMGGWLAATFASEHSHRLRKLVLVAPAGLPVPEHPTLDLLSVPPEDLPMMLAHDFNVVLPHLPKGEDPGFAAAGKREIESLARIASAGPTDPKLLRRLHRIRVPTLLLWGAEDRVIPAGQLPAWAGLIPGATIRSFANAGHLLLDESPAAVESVARFLS
jgi:pimeloyl-ACP methyl ester carboxylesterase